MTNPGTGVEIPRCFTGNHTRQTHSETYHSHTDSFVTTTTEKDQGTLHPYTFPAKMAAHGQITEKRTGQLAWEYAVASRNIYDTLIYLAESDDTQTNTFA